MKVATLHLSLLAALATLVGCISHQPFNCEASEQCLRGADQGVCEPQGFCSFDSADCPSGREFESMAGDGLAGTCVDPTDPDIDAGIVTCGAVGESCCAGDTCDEFARCETSSMMCTACGGLGEACCGGTTTCGQNKFCNAGTCDQCVLDYAAGRRHSCLLKYDGTVWCIGENEKGQLAGGAVGGMPTAIPVQVTATAGANPVDDVVAIGAGREHTCAIRSGGEVWCWGENGQSQLGDATTADSPIALQVLRASDVMPLTDIVDVQLDANHTCGRDSSGNVWCWGRNSSGELGDGTTINRGLADQVLMVAAGAPFTGAVDLTGSTHTCARKADDTVWCWGRNTNGQAGDGTLANRTTPAQVFIAASVVAGRRHTCAAKLDGTVWCWGSGWRNRLGTGIEGASLANQPNPVQVVMTLGGSPLDDIVEVAAGASSCAITSERKAFCWGNNDYGQLGTTAGALTPLPVLGPGGEPLAGIARLVANYNRTCAFLDDGSLLCFGRNLEGQLGDGTFVSRGTPTPVSLSCP